MAKRKVVEIDRATQEAFDHWTSAEFKTEITNSLLSRAVKRYPKQNPAHLVEAARGNPYTALEHYIKCDEQIPSWLGKSILEERRPKTGRNARPNAKALQLANDWICSLAVDTLLATGMSQTAAQEITGKRMNKSFQSIRDARRRHRARYH